MNEYDEYELRPYDESWYLLGLSEEGIAYFAERGFRPSQVDFLKKGGMVEVERMWKIQEEERRQAEEDRVWAKVGVSRQEVEYYTKGE